MKITYELDIALAFEPMNWAIFKHELDTAAARMFQEIFGPGPDHLVGTKLSETHGDDKAG